MITTTSTFRQHISLSLDQLLTGGEIIVIVDDDPDIREALTLFLEGQGFSVKGVGRGDELLRLFDTDKVALILLDIGLPDIDGISLLPKLVEHDPDTVIVMLTGVAELNVALECIRKGADDYLSKPAKFDEILFIVKKTLEKRRLIFENRKYQEDLEKAHFRIQLMHQLSLKMNSVYLSTVVLDEILQAILVGITANEGLRFNRAFLAMFDEENRELKGRMAIGATCREEAAKIWSEMREKELSFLDIVQNIRKSCSHEDGEVNAIIKGLHVPITEEDDLLIRSALSRRSYTVSSENGCVPVPLERRSVRFNNGQEVAPYLEERRKSTGGASGVQAIEVPDALIRLLDEKDFCVVPLYSPGRSLGVIIADNFVTRQPITDAHVNALELFASQASLAVEHSHFYLDMQNKIKELEALNYEIDKNKDLLVAAEKYTALGQMAAQMVHVIRNPITSIGGVARILSKKVENEEWEKYLQVMVKETARLETTLEDLFDFVSQAEVRMETAPLYPLLRKTLMLVQANIEKQSIETVLDLPDPEPVLSMDLRQIRLALLHLIKNAIEAMPDGGALALSVRTENEWVLISVADTGIGIHDVHMEKARDSFFTTKTYGTGMGLALVERVVKAHDGRFELRKKEVGTEVVVSLPL